MRECVKFCYEVTLRHIVVSVEIQLHVCSLHVAYKRQTLCVSICRASYSSIMSRLQGCRYAEANTHPLFVLIIHVWHDVTLSIPQFRCRCRSLSKWSLAVFQCIHNVWVTTIINQIAEARLWSVSYLLQCSYIAIAEPDNEGFPSRRKRGTSSTCTIVL